MGVQLDDSTEQRREGASHRPSAHHAPERPANASRRRFSRGAIAGGAVLLSLGNRAAWGGGTTHVAGCMSLATLNSFNPETGMFISAPAGRPDHNEDLAREIHRIGDPPDFTGRDGDWEVCEDPGSLDRVCLVRGQCPR